MIFTFVPLPVNLPITSDLRSG